MDREMMARCMYEFLPGGGEWQTTPPTEPGLYWAFYKPDHKPGEVQSIEIVFRVDTQKLTAIDFDWLCPLSELKGYTHWLGPLPVPALPVDVESKIP